MVGGVGDDTVVGEGSVVSHGEGSNGVQGDHGGLALGEGPVGGDGGLDLRQALAVVGLGHAGVGGAEGLGLGQSPHLGTYQ